MNPRAALIFWIVWAFCTGGVLNYWMCRADTPKCPPAKIIVDTRLKGMSCDPLKRLWNPTTGESWDELICDKFVSPAVIQPTPDPNTTVLIQ